MFPWYNLARGNIFFITPNCYTRIVLCRLVNSDIKAPQQQPLNLNPPQHFVFVHLPPFNSACPQKIKYLTRDKVFAE